MELSHKPMEFTMCYENAVEKRIAVAFQCVKMHSMTKIGRKQS